MINLTINRYLFFLLELNKTYIEKKRHLSQIKMIDNALARRKKVNSMLKDLAYPPIMELWNFNSSYETYQTLNKTFHESRPNPRKRSSLVLSNELPQFLQMPESERKAIYLSEMEYEFKNSSNPFTSVESKFSS